MNSNQFTICMVLFEKAYIDVRGANLGKLMNLLPNKPDRTLYLFLRLSFDIGCHYNIANDVIKLHGESVIKKYIHTFTNFGINRLPVVSYILKLERQ